MIQAARLQVVVGAETAGAERELRSFSSTLGQTARNWGMLGASMSLGVTAPMVAAAKSVIGMGVGFESAFTGVIKTVDATEAQIAALRTGILDMSKALPASANEIAGVAEAAGQLGIHTENILGFTRVMIDLGETTNLTATQAATDLARLANITQMPQENFDRLGSTIVALGNNLATTEAEIVTMALRLAGAGAQIGMSEAQILGLAGALSSVGIEAEAGGTALSRVMVDMASAVAEGGEKLTLFAEVAGMSSAAFAEAFRTDAAGAIVTFIEGLGRISASGENVFATLESLELADIRVRDALLRASGAGDLFRTSLDLANVAWQENIALTREAELRYGTTQSAIDMATNRLTAFGVALFDAIRPNVNAVVVGISEFLLQLTSLAEGLSTVNPALISAGLAFAGVVAAAGPVIGVLAAVAGALSLLGGAAGPILLVVGATAALAAAWAGDFGGIRSATQQTVEFVRPYFAELLGWISAASQGDFAPLKEGLQGALTSVQATIENFDWVEFVTPLEDWGAYIVALDWKQIITETIDWGVWITTLPWNMFVTLLDWTAYLSALAWSEWISRIDWAQWVTSVDWSQFIVTLSDWSLFVGRVTWESFVQHIEWPQFVTALSWESFVEQLGNWDQWIPTLDWTAIITGTVEWSAYIAALAWNAFVAVLDWAFFLGVVAWNDYISQLTWSGVITTLDNWSTYVEQLVWGTLIAAFEWGMYIGSLNWGDFVAEWKSWNDYVNTLFWSEFVEHANLPAFVTAIDWGDFVADLEWPTIPVVEWSTYISEVAWSALIAPVEWASYLFRINWSDFVKQLLWSLFVPTVNWSAYIPRMTWPTWQQILDEIRAQLPGWLGGGRAEPQFQDAPSRSAPPTIGAGLGFGALGWGLGVNPLGSREPLEVPVVASEVTLGAQAQTRPLEMTALITDVKPTANLALDTWFGSGLSGAIDQAMAGRAVTTEAPRFEWPELPEWKWPDLPVFRWPELPRWTWPAIPRPSWIDELQVPRPSWLGELLTWSPVVQVRSAPATVPGQLAEGTDNWRGGWTWVGERGPELVNLPRGSRVLDNETSMAAAGGIHVTIHATVANDLDLKQVAYEVAREIQWRLKGR